MQARRERGVAKVCADRAGIIDSSRGSAITLLAPRSTWRRERCFLVRKFMTVSPVSAFCDLGGGGHRDFQPEGITRGNAKHDVRKAVAAFLSVPDNVANGGHVLRMQVAPQ